MAVSPVVVAERAIEPKGISVLWCQDLLLLKHGQQWIFRYEMGAEALLLRALADLSRDPHCGFDWFDAAIISHQLGDELHQQLKKLMEGGDDST